MQDQILTMSKATEIIDKGLWTTTHLLLIMYDFQELQKIILEVLTDNKQIGISHRWLKPDQLKEQLWIIKQNLPSDSRLLGEDIIDQSLKVYQFGSMDVEMLGNHLIVTIGIPFVRIHEYDCYRLITIPFINNDKQIRIRRKSDYFLVNEKNMEFLMRSQSEMDECKRIDNAENKICPMSKIIKDQHQIECEWKMFKNSSEIPNECIILVEKSEELWQPLQLENSWIFSMNKPTNCVLKCDGFDAENITLKNSGIITIFGNCEFETENFKVMSHYSKYLNESIKINEYYNMNETESLNFNFNTTRIQRMMNRSEINTDELRETIMKMKKKIIIQSSSEAWTRIIIVCILTVLLTLLCTSYLHRRV